MMLRADQAVRTHIAIITSLHSACEERGVKFWLLGGWGIDALCRRITREHHDIDLVTSLCSRQPLRDLIVGFADEVEEDTPQKLRLRKNDVRVDVRFFYRHANGMLVMDLDADDPLVWPMPPASFPDGCNGALAGRACRAISWAAQYVAKEGWRHFKPQEELRPKDRQDLGLILAHLSEQEIEEAQRYLPGIPR
jgi:lincosamide nucleotidyltransferase A/C/D/E